MSDEARYRCQCFRVTRPDPPAEAELPPPATLFLLELVDRQLARPGLGRLLHTEHDPEPVSSGAHDAYPSPFGPTDLSET